jgi:hypothetical protein
MNYIDAQLFKCLPFPLDERNSSDDRNGQIKLKIHTIRGETNWLNVSPDQMREIEQILNKSEVTE